MGAVGHQRAHVLHRELVGEIVAPPAHRVEGMGGVHATRVHALHLGDDLEAPRLVARVERARIAVVALAVREEAAGGGRLALLGIAREALVHPVVLGPGRDGEAMRDALGHDQEVALPVFDGPERRLQRAPALMHEVDARGGVVLEEVVHRRLRRRHVHGHGGVGDQPRHAAVHVAGGRRAGPSRGRGGCRPPRASATPSGAPTRRRPAPGPPRRSSWWAGRDGRCGSPCRRSRPGRAPARRRGGGAGPRGARAARCRPRGHRRSTRISPRPTSSETIPSPIPLPSGERAG